jgi:phosphatidylglycerophosphatase A
VTAAERIATLGGLGRIVPRAPGTVASLLTVVVAWGLSAVYGQLLVIVAAIAATAVGFWGAELYARQSGTKDPSECVIDEVAGQLFACAFAPRALVPYALAFVFFRALDIVKPWPIGAAERLPGGLGIMADDVIAGVVAGVLVAILFRAHLLGG